MAYIFHIDTNKEQFDEFVMNSSQNNLFQCTNWAKVKNNWEPLYTSVTEEDKIVGVGLVLIRKIIGSKTLFYIPRGPILDYTNPNLIKFYFDELSKIAKERKAVAIRFDPAILVNKYAYKDRNNKPENKNMELIPILASIGSAHKGFTTLIEEATQPRYNAEMDVEEDYFSHLEHKTVKCINASIRKGIELYEGKQYIDDFAIAMHYTEVRKKVALRNIEYFKNMLDVYGDKGICMVTKLNFPKQINLLKERIESQTNELNENPSKKRRAELERFITQDSKELLQIQEDYRREGKEEVITGGILACYNDKMMELFYMGNHPDYLRMYSSYLLYKSCLDRCVEKGIKICSFGGIEGTLDDGLTLFKSNWLMNVEEYIGEFNIVFDKVTYQLFDQIYPQVLKFAAKMKGNK